MNGMLRVDLSSLDALMEDLGDSAEAAARPAAQAAAQVLYDAVVRNVAQLGRSTGKLSSSIYQVYSEDHSGPGRATYHISWNHRKAPHGHLVEFGYIQRYRCTSAQTVNGIPQCDRICADAAPRVVVLRRPKRTRTTFPCQRRARCLQRRSYDMLLQPSLRRKQLQKTDCWMK